MLHNLVSMRDEMNPIIASMKEAFTSKKFVAAFSGAIVAASLKLGLEMSTADVAI